MTNIHQVIVRNNPPKGLDVVAATITKSQIQDLSQYIPKKRPSKFNEVYLTKFLHISGKIGLRFTFDDGTDQFGRKAIKTHTFIIDNCGGFGGSSLVNGFCWFSFSVRLAASVCLLLRGQLFLYLPLSPVLGA